MVTSRRVTRFANMNDDATDQALRRPSAAAEAANAALRESEARLRRLFETITDGILIAECSNEQGQAGDFVCLEANKVFEDLTGIEGIRGNPVSMLVPILGASLLDTLGRVVETSQPTSGESTYSAASNRWYRAHYSRLGDSRVASRLEDITDRHRTEITLRESESWLAAQKEALQGVISGAKLEDSLDILSRAARDSIGHDARCAFYLVDPELDGLRHMGGMPEAYGSKVDGFSIGPGSFACGLAHRG
jgi:PAS domain-containing protein